MKQWAYEMTHQDLVTEFADVCARLGTVNSGLVISMTGSSRHARDVQYLEGVLMARLDGVQPPFKRDHVVHAKIKNGATSMGLSRIVLKQDQPVTIHRIHYDKGRWLLEFRGVSNRERESPLFSASDFVL